MLSTDFTMKLRALIRKWLSFTRGCMKLKRDKLFLRIS